MTRGALYHHFESKEEIFILVYKELVEQLVKAIRFTIRDIDDPWEKALAGCRSYLDFCVEPAYKNVCLNDAIRVMGWKKWRDVSSDYTMDLLKELLAGLTGPGKQSVHSIDHVANLLYSLLVEAVMTISNSPDKKKAHDDVASIISKMLLGLRATQ